ALRRSKCWLSLLLAREGVAIGVLPPLPLPAPLESVPRVDCLTILAAVPPDAPPPVPVAAVEDVRGNLLLPLISPLLPVTTPAVLLLCNPGRFHAGLPSLPTPSPTTPLPSLLPGLSPPDPLI